MRASTIAAGALGALTIAGVAYTAIAIAGVRAFRKRAANAKTGGTPPVTVLKPLHGDEPHLLENLNSFCNQDYPEFQVVFGAADAADPALQVARAVAAAHPQLDIAVAGGNAKPAANPKIGNLLGIAERARHDIILIADSDIRVGPGYLRAVMACFDDPQVGAVTCIYGGIPGESLASELGAMQINEHFAPSVMVADLLEPLTYCFGATMAVRRPVLERIGGLDALADHLADDYLLGKLVTQTGARIALAPYCVQTTVADESLQQLWLHERRWNRAVLEHRPAGYAGAAVTYALPIATAFAAFAGTPFSIGVLAVAAALRMWLRVEATSAFALEPARRAWLIPVRDALSVAGWFGAFWGKRVRWKSDDYRLKAGGRMAAGTKEM